jgi:hypothetical protein
LHFSEADQTFVFDLLGAFASWRDANVFGFDPLCELRVLCERYGFIPLAQPAKLLFYPEASGYQPPSAPR